MSTDDYAYLFYDKAAGSDHGYQNAFTKNITIESMFTSDNKYFEGIEAINEFNKFGGIYTMPVDLFPMLYNVYLFHYVEAGVKIKVAIVAVNKKELKKYIVEKKSFEKFI